MKKKKKKRGTETHSGNGISFQTPGDPLTGGSVGNFGIPEGNITGRKNK